MMRRFWEKVMKSSGCWIWKGAHNQEGYGSIGIGSRTDGTRRLIKAHRMCWYLTYGVIPVGMCVLHRCDNPTCVNPDHLFLGTHADNMRDKKIKGRAKTGPLLFGEAHPRSRLHAEDVHKIRKMSSEEGLSQSQIGKLFGVSQTHVGRILRKQRWRDGAR